MLQFYDRGRAGFTYMPKRHQVQNFCLTGGVYAPYAPCTSTPSVIRGSLNPKLAKSITLIIIIIMAHRRQWSVATTLHDVHVPPHSATSVSNWLGFPRRPAVSMSSGDAQEVFASLYQESDQTNSLRRFVPVLGVLVWWRPV